MSFLSRLFSSSKDQDMPSLAELLEARGVPADLPGLNDELLDGFGSMRAREREAAADAIAALHGQGHPLPPPWNDAQHDLVPQVVPTWQGEREPFHYRPCFDRLCSRLLLGGKPVYDEWFTLWDIPEGEAMEIALDIIEERSKDKPFARQASGIFCSSFGDGLDASRILLPHHWNNLFPGQNTFVAMPKQDTLLVAPQVLLPKLVEAIGDILANSSASEILVVTMYQWVDGKLMPASLQEPHPMIQPQREFRQLDSIAAYSAQAAELAKMQVGEPCHLGLVRTQQGRTLTLATWAEGRTALLPDSDLVGFVSSKGKPLGLYWRQTFPRLHRIKGEQVDIWGPRRLSFKEFPNAGELEQLECFANAEAHAQIMAPGQAKQGRQAPRAQGGQAKPKAQQSDAASALYSSNSPVPSHLRGLSLGMPDDD